MRLFLTITLLFLAAVSHAQAQAPGIGTERKRILLRVGHEYIVPRYEILTAAMQSQKDAWDAFCVSPGKDGFASVQSQFQQAADAWSGIEFVLYGPISVDYRFERMAHWPERNNAVSRGLVSLLVRTGDDLTPQSFAGVSAASQGLTALERLLYEPTSSATYLAKDDAAKRRCAVSVAIATGLARTSSQVRDEWREPHGTLMKLEQGDDGVAEEALTRIATDLMASLEIIYDKKLAAVMGKMPDGVRATLAEGWRSGRSMRAIAINLESNAALSKILLDQTRDKSLLDALETARSLAGTLPSDIGKLAADPKQRPRLVLLRDAVRSARDLAELSLPTALGVIIGFNSRDGD